MSIGEKYLKKNYYIRSSLLGNEVVTEVDRTGKKQKSFVFAGGTRLATQNTWEFSGQTNERLYFRQNDASGASLVSTQANGTIMPYTDDKDDTPAELDALGQNVGNAPPPTPPINQPPNYPDWNDLMPEDPLRVNGQVVKANVDGMSLPYGLGVDFKRYAMDRLRSGSAVPGQVNQIVEAQVRGLIPDSIDARFEHILGNTFSFTVSGLTAAYDIKPDSVSGIVSYGDSWNFHEALNTPDPDPRTNEEIYNSCKTHLNGLAQNRVISSPGMAGQILRISKQEGISSTLFAVTWTGESGFGWFGDSIVNNNNDGTEGNVDIGPMQINYNTFKDFNAMYPKNRKGKRMFDTSDVFGTNLEGNQIFNGSEISNLTAGARILKSYGGTDRNKAGLYRSGNGKFRKTKAGQDAYNSRTALYDSLKKSYDNFFKCLIDGGFEL